jgi:mannonate dehydratase
MQDIGAATLGPSRVATGGLPRPQIPAPLAAGWCPKGPGTPKLSLVISLHTNEAAMRRLKQIGMNHAHASGPPNPWQEYQIGGLMASFQSGSLMTGNIMIGGLPNTIYEGPRSDEEINNVGRSIRAAGRAGQPIIEYNFYAHRFVEGYYAQTGRAGAGLTGFDYEWVKNLLSLPSEGIHNGAEMWSNIPYFLKAVIPVAEESGVRLALHPNDPPVPLSRGFQQIIGTLEGWKHLIEIVPGKCNGISFDYRMTREMGHDPVEVCSTLEPGTTSTICISGTFACKCLTKNTPKCFWTRDGTTCSSSRRSWCARSTRA